MPSSVDTQLLDIAQRSLALARAKGADSSDAVIVGAESTEVEVRQGETESIERAEGRELGLRVFIGNSHAVVSASRFQRDDLEELAERAVAMARAAPADPFAGLPDARELAQDDPGLDLADNLEPTADQLLKLALETEEAGLAVAGVSKSSGADASASRRTVCLATSNGFARSYTRTGFGISAAMIAGSGAGMERDYDYSRAVHFRDLEQPSEVGRSAGELAVKRLNPRKIESRRVPVVFERRLAGGVLGHLASAILGSAIARGTSFLKDRLGQQVFPKGIRILDEGRRANGLASRPFDGEGVATGRTVVVDDGVLKTWLLDCRSARQLGLRSTGHASRSPGGAPSPSSTNLHIEAGAASPSELIKRVGEGLLVTELLGMGVNGVTGDYSRGATGFWIEGGEIAYPVSEITIAGNLMEMFASLEPANDLEFRGSTNAPTLLAGEMTIAGV